MSNCGYRQTWDICITCHGEGTVWYSAPTSSKYGGFVTCRGCNGKGRIYRQENIEKPLVLPDGCFKNYRPNTSQEEVEQCHNARNYIEWRLKHYKDENFLSGNVIEVKIAFYIRTYEAANPLLALTQDPLKWYKLYIAEDVMNNNGVPCVYLNLSQTPVALRRAKNPLPNL